jgi:hypothetical protein
VKKLLLVTVIRCSGCSLYVAWLIALVLGIQHKSQPSPVIIARLLHPILIGNRGFARSNIS